MVRAFLLIAAVAIFGAGQNPQHPQPETFIPGTRVGLVPPPGFTPASHLSGFWQESLAASIMVMEFPGPFAEVSRGLLNTSELAKRQMEVLTRQEVKVNNETGWLLHVKQIGLGTEYRKWLLILGDDKETVLVVAAFPKEMERELSDKMKASVLTTRWDRTRKAGLTDGLNFTCTEVGEMKLAKRIANSLAFTKSGVFPSKAQDDPLFIVGQAMSKVDVKDKEEFARLRLSQTTSVTGVEVESFKPVTIDDLAGYEILAKGKDTESSTPMTIYLVLLYEDQSYYIMQGLVSAKASEAYVPAFKEMARSFKRRR